MMSNEEDILISILKALKERLEKAKDDAMKQHEEATDEELVRCFIGRGGDKFLETFFGEDGLDDEAVVHANLDRKDVVGVFVHASYRLLLSFARGGEAQFDIDCAHLMGLIDETSGVVVSDDDGTRQGIRGLLRNVVRLSLEAFSFCDSSEDWIGSNTTACRRLFWGVLKDSILQSMMYFGTLFHELADKGYIPGDEVDLMDEEMTRYVKIERGCVPCEKKVCNELDGAAQGGYRCMIMYGFLLYCMNSGVSKDPEKSGEGIKWFESTVMEAAKIYYGNQKDNKEA